MTARPLVVGGDSLLGSALVDSLAGSDATSRRQGAGSRYLDLAAAAESWEIPHEVSVAFLCAAVTGERACSADPAASRSVNVEATCHLAERLLGRGAFVVFPSTSLVFDGSMVRSRIEDAVRPRTEYGRQKAEAEAALRALGDSVAVVRLTKILSPTPALLQGWVDRLVRNEQIDPFDDMVMAPVSLRHAVHALRLVADRRLAGLSQVSASRDVSYADVGRHLAKRLGVALDLVQPSRARDAGLPEAMRPRHTCLDTSLLERAGLETPDPVDSIDEVIRL